MAVNSYQICDEIVTEVDDRDRPVAAASLGRAPSAAVPQRTAMPTSPPATRQSTQAAEAVLTTVAAKREESLVVSDKPSPKPLRDKRISPLWWFPFNTHRFSSDFRISELTDYQLGWLLWLWVEAWKREGRLPYDWNLLRRLARAKSKAKFEKEKDVILQFFEPIGDGSVLEERELRQMWEEKRDMVEQKIKSGRLGGNSK